MYNDSVSDANTTKYLLENKIILLNILNQNLSISTIQFVFLLLFTFWFLFLVRNFKRSLDKFK